MAGNANVDEDLGPGLYAFCIVMIITSFLAVLLRFWSRAITCGSGPSRRIRFWWDDWLALANLPLIVAGTAAEMYWIHLGLGRHISQLPQENVTKGLKILYALYPIYNVGISLAKSSALFFYARIFTVRATSRSFKYILWTTHFFIFGWAVGTSVSAIFQCTPIDKAWYPDKDGHCLPEGSWWLGSAITSVIIDLIILVIPMPILWRLHLKLSRKLLITAVFVLGYSVIVVSIGRLVSIGKIGEALGEDLTYNAVPINYWQTIEAPISLLAVCLPAIYALVKRGMTYGFYSLITSQNQPSRASSSGQRSWLDRHVNRTRTATRIDGPRKDSVNDSDEAALRPEAGVLEYSVSAVPAGSQKGSTQSAEGDVIPLEAIHVRRDLDIDNS